jgi:hypothetical protein
MRKPAVLNNHGSTLTLSGVRVVMLPVAGPTWTPMSVERPSSADQPRGSDTSPTRWLRSKDQAEWRRRGRPPAQPPRPMRGRHPDPRDDPAHLPAKGIARAV